MSIRLVVTLCGAWLLSAELACCFAVEPSGTNPVPTSEVAIRRGLDIYVPGVYAASFSAEDADGRVQRMEGRATVSRILGGHFVQIDIEAGRPPTRAMTLVQYDSETGISRTWFFTDSGYVTQGESRASEQEARTSLSQGTLNHLNYKGTTTHSEDYTTVVETYRWYDAAGTLLRTDISRFQLLRAQPDGAANRSQPIRAETNRKSVAAGSDR